MGPRRPLELSGGFLGTLWQRRSSRHNEKVREFDVKAPNWHVKFANLGCEVNYNSTNHQLIINNKLSRSILNSILLLLFLHH